VLSFPILLVFLFSGKKKTLQAHAYKVLNAKTRNKKIGKEIFSYQEKLLQLL